MHAAKPLTLPRYLRIRYISFEELIDHSMSGFYQNGDCLFEIVPRRRGLCDSGFRINES